MSTNISSYSIQSTWSGASLSSEEQYHFFLEEQEHGLELSWEAPLFGDPKPQGKEGFLDGLWEYEVVEWFLVSQKSLNDLPHYIELEFSPHGHYLAIELRGIRKRTKTWEELHFEREIHEKRWKGWCWIPKTLLPEKPWLHNFFAIHGVGNQRRYLAMNPLPGAQPNFHQPHLFSPL